MKYKSVLQHSEEDCGAAAIARHAKTLYLARLGTLSSSTNYLSVRAVSGVRVILYAAGTIES